MKPVVGRECFSQESKYFCSIFFRHCYSPTSMYMLDIKYYTWFLLPISRKLSEAATAPLVPMWNYKENSHVGGGSGMFHGLRKLFPQDYGRGLWAAFLRAPSLHQHWYRQLSKREGWHNTAEISGFLKTAMRTGRVSQREMGVFENRFYKGQLNLSATPEHWLVETLP